MTETPRWALEDYAGAEVDFTSWLHSLISKKLANLLAGMNTEKLSEEELDAQANLMVLERTKRISGLSDRAFLFQLYEANRTGWYRLLPARMDSIEDLLAQILEASEGKDAYYQYAFLVETVLPMVKLAGAKPEDVWGLAVNTGKALAAVPALRDAMRCPRCGSKKFDGTTCAKCDTPLTLDEDKTEAVLDLVRQVSDPAVSVSDFQQSLARARGKITGSLRPLETAQVYLMPGGEEWLLVKSPSSEYTAALTGLLRGTILQFDITDVYQLLSELSEKLLGLPVQAGFDQIVEAV